MKTTINNNERVFQVLASAGVFSQKQAFCNLKDLNKVCKEFNCVPGYFKINHFWNNKPQRVTKKELKELFKNAGLEQKFTY